MQRKNSSVINILLNMLLIIVSIFVSSLIIRQHAIAQAPQDQQVPTDYVLDIDQGEKQLQQNPQAMEIIQRIKQSESLEAYEDGVATPVLLQVAEEEAKESVTELQPKPSSTDTPVTQMNDLENNIQSSEGKEQISQPTVEQPSSPEDATNVQGASTGPSIQQQILRGMRRTYYYLFH